MGQIGYASVEAIGLKIYALEKEAIYNKEVNSKNYDQIEALWWVADLLGVSKEVSKIRQKQTEISNKSWEAARKAAERDMEDSKCIHPTSQT